jgi:ubiquinone/menaquinone biosynthesis C-methylase UbiE
MFAAVVMKILEGRPRSYDRRMDLMSRGRVREAKEAVAREVPTGAHVLEIGCGTGELAQLLAERGLTVEGFDRSPAMIAVAEERVHEQGLEKQVTVRQMGVEGMDELPDRGFDAVVATLVLSELSDGERRYALQHAHRVLRPGGAIVMADEVVPRRGWRRVLGVLARAPTAAITHLVASSCSRPLKDVGKDLRQAGFTLEREHRWPGDALAIVAGRRPGEEGESPP